MSGNTNNCNIDWLRPFSDQCLSYKYNLYNNAQRLRMLTLLSSQFFLLLSIPKFNGTSQLNWTAIFGGKYKQIIATKDATTNWKTFIGIKLYIFAFSRLKGKY